MPLQLAGEEGVSGDEKWLSDMQEKGDGTEEGTLLLTFIQESRWHILDQGNTQEGTVV